MSSNPCPYCESDAPVSREDQSGLVECGDCGRTYAAAGALVQGPEARSRRRTRRTGGPTEIPLLGSGGVAVAATAVFYLGIVLPLRANPLGALFAERGWVPYAVTLLAFWAVAILSAKWVSLLRQRRSLDFELLPAEIATHVTPDNAQAFASYLRNLPEARRGSFLIDRVERALQQLRARPSVPEVVEHLRAQADADADAVDASYAMVRVFIWAIPILGFIGTVIGIGQAVGGFSEAVGAAADLVVLKSSIGSVTDGLGVAFDTTLLALIVSLLIMFPASSLQRAEEQHLAAVDDYCHTHLLRRIDDGRGEPHQDVQLAARQVAVMERLASAIDDLEQRLAKAERSPGDADPERERPRGL